MALFQPNKIKPMKTKTNIILLLLIVVTLSSMVMDTVHSNKTSSPCDSPVVGDHSGAPGETNCTACHGGTPNTGSGLLEFHVGNDSTYVPGQTYTCNVKMSQTGLDKFGFVNLALKNSGNTTIGTFNLIDAVRTRKYTLGGRNYFSHTPCGADADTIGKNEWTYSWTAPSSNVGTITLYISGLAANHNEATTGDFTYTKTIVLNPSAASSIEEIPGTISNINIYPNPASEKLAVEFQTYSTNTVSIELIDVEGRQIELLKPELVSQGAISRTIDIKDKSIKQGIYLLKITIGDKSISKRISIL